MLRLEMCEMCVEMCVNMGVKMCVCDVWLIECLLCPRKQPVTPCRFLGEDTAGAWQPVTVFEMKKR